MRGIVGTILLLVAICVYLWIRKPIEPNSLLRGCTVEYVADLRRFNVGACHYRIDGREYVSLGNWISLSSTDQESLMYIGVNDKATLFARDRVDPRKEIPLVFVIVPPRNFKTGE